MADGVESSTAISGPRAFGLDLSWPGSWPWVGLVAAGLLLLLVIGQCLKSPSISVEAAVVREAALTIRVTTNGKVEPIDPADVRSRLDGRILEIPEPGARVEAGGLLLRIDGGPAASELKAAESERLAALDSLRSARNELERIRGRAGTDAELFEKGAITRERYQEGRAELREARQRVEFLEREVPLRVEALDLRIEELRARRDASVVRAPFAGTVYRTDLKRGETVRVGDPVLWFADLERLRVRANVDQVDLGRVKVGQEVRITSNAYANRHWAARITEIIPNVVMRDSRFVAEALARVEPPAEGLVPGMTVDVEVIVESVPRALQVPSEAVFTDEQGPFVYAIDGRQARKTRVELGRTTVATIEIVGGLEANDRVALGPVEGLEDGAQVKARIHDGG